MSERPVEGGTLLRVFVGELDKSGGVPLYERILQVAQEAGMAGVTILRGVESYGAQGAVHSAHILRLSEDLPMVLEIVDTPKRVDAFLPQVDALLDASGCGGLITLEQVRMIKYHPD